MPSILNATTTNGLVTSADNSGSLQLQTNNGTTAVTIDTSQNVGIGTTSPTVRLQVNGGIAVQGANFPSAGAGIELSYNSGTSLASFQSYDRTGSAWKDLEINALTQRFGTNGSERMRINSSGDVTVGTTSTNPVASRVNGAVIQNNGSIQSRSPAGFSYYGLNVTSGVNITFYTDNGSAFVTAGNISSNGSSTAYNTSSDYRMKTDVMPMVGGLNKVMQLKPVTYKWKDEFAGTNPDGEGFIAHELQEVCPDAVSGTKDDVDAEGNPRYQGVDTSFLVATLTAAIQELKAELDATKAEVQALKDK